MLLNTPWTLMLMLHIRQSIYLHLSKCFIYFISDVLHYIRWNRHNTVCATMVKVDILDTCGTMICSYFGITFLLFFMKLENTVYTSFQNSTLLFINGLIFDIMNIQNNQSFEFEWIPVLAPLRSSMIEGFHGFVMVSLSRSKIRWIPFSNTKETLQKIVARKCSYRGKHMEGWK